MEIQLKLNWENPTEKAAMQQYMGDREEAKEVATRLFGEWGEISDFVQEDEEGVIFLIKGHSSKMSDLMILGALESVRAYIFDKSGNN